MPLNSQRFQTICYTIEGIWEAAPARFKSARIALHLASANLLIPKFMGSRVNIGPVAATVGTLFWSWIWGAVGLLLAVPLTAFVKLVADCNPSSIHI
jgi:AI-2E family transporter